jgi:hypothetical protein
MKNIFIAINCGEPPLIQNSIVNYNATIFKSKAVYKCIDKRFIIEGSLNYIECKSNGKWDEYIPKCIRKYN